MDSAEAAEIRNKASDLLHHAKHPAKSNIYANEKEAIRSLKRNQDIMIAPADKGRAVVVMDIVDYKNKAESLLSDNKAYVKLKSNPTRKNKTKLVKILQSIKDKGAITDIKYRQLYPTSEEVLKFCGLPEVHKANHPLCPIVACSGSITYASAKFIADIIFSLVGQSEHHIMNSKDLVTKLQDFTLCDDEELVSYDVTVLFTYLFMKRST